MIAVRSAFDWAGRALTCLVLLNATAAKAAIEDVQPPVITFTPCETFQKGRAFTVFARFDDTSPVFEPKLVYRITGDSTWRNATFKSHGESAFWRASIPPRELTGALEYFIEVFDENGNGPARVGSPEEPLFARATRKARECAQPDEVHAIAIESFEAVGSADSSPSSLFATAPADHPHESRCKQSDPPIYCKYWFWIATGGAVVATAAIIAITAGQSSGRDYPDHVTLVVQPQALEHGR